MLPPAWTSVAGSAILPLIRRLSPRQLIAFTYHAVAPEAPRALKPLVEVKTPAAFIRDVEFLRVHYRVVGNDDVVAHVRGERTLEAPSVALTFDDGLAECHSTVRPLLLQLGVPCAFFVVRDLIDNRSLMFRHKVALCLEHLERMGHTRAREVTETASRELSSPAKTSGELAQWALGLRYRDTSTIDDLCEILGVDVDRFLFDTAPYMTSSQIRELARDGFTIGAHSCDHPELWLLEWDEIERQIVDSCTAVRELTGQQTVSFSFPFWGSGVDRRALGDLLDRYSWISCLYDSGSIADDRAFVVNRISADVAPDPGSEVSNLPSILARTHAAQTFRSLKWAASRRGPG